MSNKQLEESLRQVSIHHRAINKLMLEAFEKNKSHFEIDPNIIGSRFILSGTYDINGSKKLYQLLQFKIFDKKQEKIKCVEIFVDDGLTDFIDKIIKHANLSQGMLNPNILKVHDSYFLDDNKYFYLIEYEQFELQFEDNIWFDYKNFRNMVLKFQKDTLLNKILGRPTFDYKSDTLKKLVAFQKNIDGQYSAKFFAVNPMVFGIYEQQENPYVERNNLNVIQNVTFQEQKFQNSNFYEEFLKSENKHVELYSEIVRHLVERENSFMNFIPLYIDSNILILQMGQFLQLKPIDLVIERFNSMEDAIKKKEQIDQIMMKLSTNQIQTNIQKYEIIEIKSHIYILATFDFKIKTQEISSVDDENDFEKKVKLVTNLINCVQILNEMNLNGDLSILNTLFQGKQIFLKGYVFFQYSVQLNPTINYLSKYEFLINPVKEIFCKITTLMDTSNYVRGDLFIQDLLTKYLGSLKSSENQTHFKEIISYFKAYELIMKFNKKFQFSSQIVFNLSIQNSGHAGIIIDNPYLEQLPSLIEILQSNQELCYFFHFKNTNFFKNLATIDKNDLSKSIESQNTGGFFQNLNYKNTNFFKNLAIIDKNDQSESIKSQNTGGFFQNLNQQQVQVGGSGLFQNLSQVQLSKGSLFQNLDINSLQSTVLQSYEKQKSQRLTFIEENADIFLRKFKISEDCQRSLKEQVVQMIEDIYDLCTLKERHAISLSSQYFCNYCKKKYIKKNLDKDTQQLGFTYQSQCPCEITNQVLFKMVDTQKKVSHLYTTIFINQ
ncbi:hypothetical protein ABPG74_019808 [Tetrahymena malaccensis]